MGDFWQMVLDQQVSLVVMVNEEERMNPVRSRASNLNSLDLFGINVQTFQIDRTSHISILYDDTLTQQDIYMMTSFDFNYQNTMWQDIVFSIFLL